MVDEAEALPRADVPEKSSMNGQVAQNVSERTLCCVEIESLPGGSTSTNKGMFELICVQSFENHP